MVAMGRYIATTYPEEAEYCLFMATIFMLLLCGMGIALPRLLPASVWPYTATTIIITTYLFGGLMFFYGQKRTDASHAAFD